MENGEKKEAGEKEEIRLG